MALDALVLGTVNAPYRRSVSSTELVSVLATGKIDSWLVHISTFFTDVRPDLVIDFADAHGIGHSQLQLMYALVKGATGEASKEMEEALVELAQPA
ncbi:MULTISPECIES: hypothetical protein [Rhizobium]|uniref:Uncharacterized protein n=1 Tax=Rhizobium rhododendri TaxID=2506430 RepID=A0ABY8IFI8_9HYPH|nr:MULTISPECIES: hypothetical protein [Rhizobium]MBO9099820.1 hypothetical protein [Rhizobium sp. L58/93]MBO9131638.1 hypothetical protein [Rhizobium sp. B209b/85]MBO9169809.1 hypothetical protein [Rhizobium sp. L245/93]MBO9185767.1 hypothetical protein [Rhizobium sp. E27B/91]MBZ5759186.1 hypothetical protein [Rhizobium sp. VS19-DR96]